MPSPPELADNITLLGHTDQGGRGDGVQVMVGGGYAYVGHMFSNGAGLYVLQYQGSSS